MNKPSEISKRIAKEVFQHFDHMGDDALPGPVARIIASHIAPLEAENERLRKQVEELRKDASRCRNAAMTLDAGIATIRDDVLHGRGPLEGMDIDGDVTNAVLSIIDDNWPILDAIDAALSAQAEVVTGEST